MEGRKLFYDALKHLTTLSTGSIILLATFLEKIFSNPECKILIGITFVGFAISIISTVVLMFIFSGLVARSDSLAGSDTPPSKGISKIFNICSIVSVASFVLAMLSLVIFSLINFY